MSGEKFYPMFDLEFYRRLLRSAEGMAEVFSASNLKQSSHVCKMGTNRLRKTQAQFLCEIYGIDYDLVYDKDYYDDWVNYFRM